MTAATDQPAIQRQRCPFVVLIDTAEQHPFRFENLVSDADGGYRLLDVRAEFTALGRFPDSLGDYSLIGGVERCHVERKSREDCQGTILGFSDGRRERFEKELQNLEKLEAALVVVECSLHDLIEHAPEYGQRSKKTNAKTLFRSVLAFQQDYRVPWLFAGSRRMAEQATFRFLERWWRKKPAAERKALQEASQ